MDKTLKTELCLPSIVRREVAGIPFYTDDGLYSSVGVRIAFTTRLGGVSVAPYDELNIASHVGDKSDDVKTNRKLIFQALGAPNDIRLATLNQVHGKDVLIINSDVIDDVPSLSSLEPMLDADAIVVPNVQSSQVPIASMLAFADCVPVIMVASDGAYAVIHSGWKGVMCHVSLSALDALLSVSQSPSKLINVYIGPHIRFECFDTDTELYSHFKDEFGSVVCAGEKNISLVSAIIQDLLSAGIQHERIYDIEKCTVCNIDEFFSYRACGGLPCGRHGALAFKG